MGNSSDALMQLQVARLLKNLQKNTGTKKKNSNKGTKTPYFNRGLRRFFQDKEGFFVLLRVKSKNGKMTLKKHYLPGLFVYKNYGNKIAPWAAKRGP